MFENGQLNRCQVRKAALLRQSTANRLALAEELERLRPVAAWVDLGITVASKARIALSALAPLLSGWNSRKPEASGFSGKLTRAISIGRSIAALWGSWR